MRTVVDKRNLETTATETGHVVMRIGLVFWAKHKFWTRAKDRWMVIQVVELDYRHKWYARILGEFSNQGPTRLSDFEKLHLIEEPS